VSVVTPPAAPRPADRGDLGQLARLFLRLGSTAFGGPAVHIAMMEEEVVRRRGWLTHDEFLDLLGATNLIPGPNSTEMAIHIGYSRAGWAGLLLAGSCFILPAVIIVTALGWAYVRFGTLPEVAALLYGIKPVVIGIVVQALVGLGQAALKTPWLAVLGVGATVAALLGVNQLLILLMAGVIVLLARGGVGAKALMPFATFRGREAGLAGGALTPILAGGAALASPSLWSLFAIFLKIGSVLFGSGYVLLAFLRADLVQRLGWISEGQLLDAVAVGQVTPGPVFTTATFIGYLVAGISGAAVATTGIFLPAFVFVALSAPWLARLRQSSSLRALLDGVNVASLALMVAVTLQLGRVALVDPVTVALALVATYCLFRYRLNSLWLVLGGAVTGLLKLAL